MSFYSDTWKYRCTREQRERLIALACPYRSAALRSYEADKPWDKLLPSTQRDLMKLNWVDILRD